ncbi:MAG: nitrous oxide reductase accessory protein NosL [Hyphomicrobiales bacterium]
MALSAALPPFVRPALAEAARVDLPAPGPRDTCPVCGMFVAKYPEWIATVLFTDGKVDHFDGAKDFFKYLLEMEKYAPGRTGADIAGLGVTDYYTVERIDARAALYALGSDVLGPMGHELVPHALDTDAADFMKDHAGRRLLAFDEIRLPMLVGLDEGRFE